MRIKFSVFVNFFLGHQHESGGDEFVSTKLRLYFSDGHLYTCVWPCANLRRAFKVVLLINIFWTFCSGALCYISTRYFSSDNKLEVFLKTRTFDNKMTNFKMKWPEYKFLPNGGYFNKLFTWCPGCNIPDCFHSQHSCSEAEKDG